MTLAQNEFNNSILKDFTLQTVHKLLNGRRLSCIRAIGIGSLCWSLYHYGNLSSARQLSIILAIKEAFPDAIVTYQELRLHTAVIRWLKEEGIDVLEPSDDFSIIPKECQVNDPNGVTLCIMPHLPIHLVDNLLLSYWEETVLDNLIIIADKFDRSYKGMEFYRNSQKPCTGIKGPIQ
uniref:SRR1-like domain-containing protein n=1 Tax=Acrobeloides nanus TaxID=290746 RepID=A0A914DBE4_9BILA